MKIENPFPELIEQAKTLDALAAQVQGENELIHSPEELGLIDRYNAWYAKACRAIPEELSAEFVNLYEGGVFVKRIRAFLTSPGEVSPLFDPENAVFGRWAHGYQEAFHASILEQRQLLTKAQQFLEREMSSVEMELVAQVGRGFPDLVRALGDRYDGRDPFPVNDEYDMQNLVGGVLRMLFGDVRDEDPTPARAGGSSRIDFVLTNPRIVVEVVEVKMTRQGLNDRELGRQLILDIERYRSHQDCQAFVALVYDPTRILKNPRGIEADLNGLRDGLAVQVVIAS